MLTTERDQYLRWKEHFQEDLNRKEPDNLEKFPEAPLDLEIDTDPPSKQEIQAAIKSLKNKKSPGIDQLNAELFKIDTVLAADTVHPVFQKIWEQAVIPNSDIKQDSKPFWKYINNLKADKQGIPTLKTKDNKTAETDQQKAEALNTQLTSVYTETEYEYIPYQTPPADKMRNIIVTTKGVEKILKNVNASKAMGPYGIDPRVLKELTGT
ncbi:unnamed protein product [Mytilus edulis]|uniref:Uncharacterized protein n=1 Tax=Mytilus edulis TaxID=6550 RepID=A0A8S3T287_MYTED|nr:unnamed protein product [Mytilus edulis]